MKDARLPERDEVFTVAGSPVDRALLFGNLALATAALVVLVTASLGFSLGGWVDVPARVILVGWFFATPLLAVFGARRARGPRHRRARTTHSVLGGLWALGMTAAVALTYVGSSA